MQHTHYYTSSICTLFPLDSRRLDGMGVLLAEGELIENRAQQPKPRDDIAAASPIPSIPPPSILLLLLPDDDMTADHTTSSIVFPPHLTW